MYFAAPFFAQDRAVTEALRNAGAVSPTTARPLTELPALDMASFGRLLEAGTVREGAPGTFYLYDRTAPTPRRLVHSLFFWIVIILIPIIFLQFTRGRP